MASRNRRRESAVLIIAGSFQIDPKTREATFAAAQEMMAETLKEKGCHAYCFSPDLSDPSVMHLFERWESENDLRAHFTTPHMARFQAALAKLAPKVIEIQKYEISSVGPVR
jgi:quinol monooxygenase YgiN